MRLAVLSRLLAISLCASAPTGGNLDLTLRLGPPSTPRSHAASDGSTPTDLTLRLGPAHTLHSPDASESSSSSGEYAAEHPVGALRDGQLPNNPGFVPAEGSVRAAVQDFRGAPSGRFDPYVPRLRTIDPGNAVGPQERARVLWEHYARYHLNAPMPSVIRDGRFQAQDARLLQRRIESLVRAKTLLLKQDRGRSFSKSEMELLTRRFVNWRKLAKRVAAGRANVLATSYLRAMVEDDIGLLQRDEELLRRIAH